MAAEAHITQPASKTTLIVAVAVLTVLAMIAGGLVGKLISSRVRPGEIAEAMPPAKAAPYADDTQVHELPAIVTNLGEPAETRVRIQVAIVYGKKDVDNPASLAGKISNDLIVFLKTLTLKQLQGASGLQGLREDLNERAAVRSGGKVRELIIENLVVQ